MSSVDKLIREEGPAKRSRFFIIFFFVVHVLGLVGVWYAWVHAVPNIVVAAIVYFFVCHLSITIGAHRYFTHGALKMHPVLERILLVLFTGVAQGSTVFWVGKHTQHHQFEDIPGKDPHTPEEGFFHSHMGWMLTTAGSSLPSKKYILKFLKNRKRYRAVWWQHEWYWYLAPVMAIGVPTLIGLLLGDLLGGFLVVGFARLMVQYHATWCVNSFGHTVGERLDGLATNFGVIALLGVRAFRFVSEFIIMPFLALITVGEVWHANHHVSSAHWRLGRKWWQLDPGAWVIWVLEKLGLVWDLQEPSDRVRVPQAREW